MGKALVGEAFAEASALAEFKIAVINGSTRLSSTSGMRARSGSVHAGANTVIWQSRRVRLSRINRLCAMIMSPTQEAPIISIFWGAVTAGFEANSASACSRRSSA